MDVRFGKGTSAALLQDPVAAVAKARKDDVPLLYWTAASWGAAIALGIDRPDLAVDFPTVRALADRALALDPEWSRGSIHELMITLDSLPEALGGNPARAREHFKKAVEIQKGLSPGPYVALATGVAVPNQDRAGIRAAAEGGAGDRSGEGSVESSRDAGYAAARSRAARSDRREVFEVRSGG